jgi:Tol biopolymer transport system component
MGEVYKARDTRLQRDVALKVLPAAFASDPQRMARFEREARMLASLNHPNIAAIYGLEESGPIRALVMELVEGPTLTDRIKAGPIPDDEAMPIAKQVADAMEYAHDKNIIHRDLKPANIKVTGDGMVKVLDFGLAKALSDEPTQEDIANSPTLSMAATRQGVILGTAAYMSPEQAKGKTVDRRADIWAFGAVLYEMLAGKQAFHGEDVTEILAAVVSAEPDWNQLPSNTPANIRTLLRRCLDKNPRRRLGHISEARILLEDVLSGAASADSASSATGKSRERLAWSVAAFCVALLAVVALGAFLYFRRAQTPAPAVRFFFSPPESWSLLRRVSANGGSPAPVAVSPNGQMITFAAVGPDGRSLLWIRPLSSLSAQPLAETEGAFAPFWSPDSRFIAFFANGKLKKIDISGGPPITLCDAMDGLGGTWGKDGVILFNPRNPPTIQKVPASGGVPIAVTTLARDEAFHLRPLFLPDGRHFLYRSYGAGVTSGSIYAASLDSSERKQLLNTDASNVLYSQGYLLFLRETTLMAQPFDVVRLELTGEAIPVAEQIQTSTTNPPNGIFSVSENGVLAYQTGTSASGVKLAWFDRSGKELSALGDPALYSDLALSPDGKRVAVSIVDPGKGRDIWIYDATRGLRTRFTFDRGEERVPAWSPDGTRLAFISNRKGHFDIYQKASDGSGTEKVLFADSTDKIYLSWLPDGQSLLYGTNNATPGTGNDLWVLPLSGDQKPVPFLQTQFNELFGQVSPDGRWVVYASNESGKVEVYVAPYHGGRSGKWQISTDGGTIPRWRRDGTEIFYLAPDNKLMAAAVNGKGSSFEVGAVKTLFESRVLTGTRYPYDVSADGQRFLISTPPDESGPTPITVVLSWTAGLKK